MLGSSPAPVYYLLVLESVVGAVKVLPAEDCPPSAVGLMCDTAELVAACFAHSQAFYRPRLLNGRFMFRRILGRETFRAFKCITGRIGYPIRLYKHSTGRRQRSAVPTMDAGAAQVAVVEGRTAHYVIDTAMAVPPPTLSKLKEPVILPVMGSQVNPVIGPNWVPQLQFAAGRHRPSVVL